MADTEHVPPSAPGAITGLYSPNAHKVVYDLAQSRRAIVTIGRDECSALYLDEYSVSSVHATLSRSGCSWMLRDHGSTNGTLVNGVKIAFPVQLTVGDRLDLGRVILYVVDESLRIPLPATSNTSLQVHQAEVYGPTLAGRIFGRARSAYYKAQERDGRKKVQS
jgi:pSer/pThr/pTyr-binding forkhead associated (FHA) protein